MSVPPRRRPARALALLATLLTAPLLAACGGGDAPAATPSTDPTAAHLQAQLDLLPTVDGATRTARELSGASLTETFTVPAGTPACLQILTRLDAGGYEVVAGPTSAAVAADTCRSPGDAAVGTGSGTATILAQGGSQIALTWTASAYTVVVTAA